MVDRLRVRRLSVRDGGSGARGGAPGMTTAAPRPLPQPDPDTEPFWAAAGDGVLLLQRCVAAGHVQFYPRPLCVTCAADVESFAASGRGEVHTFTVVHKSGAPPF